MKKSLIFSLFIMLWFASVAQTPDSLSHTFKGPKHEIDSILSRIHDFSAFFVAKDYESLANAYTEDGKIFPNKSDIITGREAIRKRWVLPDNQTVTYHHVTPLEIEVIGETAYDHGYYEGKTQFKDGETIEWKGKYVIVWKKIAGDWLIYLDIWNRL